MLIVRGRLLFLLLTLLSLVRGFGELGASALRVVARALNPTRRLLTFSLSLSVSLLEHFLFEVLRELVKEDELLLGAPLLQALGPLLMGLLQRSQLALFEG